MSGQSRSARRTAAAGRYQRNGKRPFRCNPAGRSARSRENRVSTRAPGPFVPRGKDPAPGRRTERSGADPRRAERRGDLGPRGCTERIPERGRQTGPVRTPPHPTGPRGGAELSHTPLPPPRTPPGAAPPRPFPAGRRKCPPPAAPLTRSRRRLPRCSWRLLGGPRGRARLSLRRRKVVGPLLGFTTNSPFFSFVWWDFFFFSLPLLPFGRRILSSLFLSSPPSLPPNPSCATAAPGPGPPRRRPPRARAPSAPPTAAARAPALATGSPRPRPGRGGREAGRSGAERLRAGHDGKGGPPGAPRARPMRCVGGGAGLCGVARAWCVAAVVAVALHVSAVCTHLQCSPQLWCSAQPRCMAAMQPQCTEQLHSTVHCQPPVHFAAPMHSSSARHGPAVWPHCVAWLCCAAPLCGVLLVHGLGTQQSSNACPSAQHGHRAQLQYSLQPQCTVQLCRAALVRGPTTWHGHSAWTHCTAQPQCMAPMDRTAPVHGVTLVHSPMHSTAQPQPLAQHGAQHHAQPQS